MSVKQLLRNINTEDQAVPMAVKNTIPELTKLVEHIVTKMRNGGRLFYIGSGTSGRLGILDASECPPTYGVPEDLVIGIIAGGDRAIRKSVEQAEDSKIQAWEDLSSYFVNEQDVVIGIAASGSTPYVVNGLKDCQKHQIITGCITCNPESPIVEYADYPIVAIVGPEFVTGSTRMKSGTAQKLILNMISTSVMIQLGRVVDNKMVDMKLSNAKLMDRGTKMVMKALDIPYDKAHALLLAHGSVRNAIESKG